MNGTRDGSVWKNLALALGDGLAFGVGVNISNNAAARIAPTRPEVRTLAERLNEIENRIERARQNNALPGQFNQKVVEAVVAVVDARLREQEARFDQKLADAIAGLRAEFSEQLAVNRKHAEEENHVLRGQMTALHRQFAESLGKIVDEQIAATIDVRITPVETKLREEIREQAGRAAGMVASAADEYLAERMQPMETAVADLDRRLGENDRNTLELVLALGQLCLQTAERLSIPEPQIQTQPDPIPPPEPSPDAAPAPSTGPQGLWRIPLVSSFFVATGGLLLLHYL